MSANQKLLDRNSQVTEVNFIIFFQAGGYTTANYVWDILQSRNITPSLPAVEAYHKGLKVSFRVSNLWFSSQYTFFTLDRCKLYSLEKKKLDSGVPGS